MSGLKVDTYTRPPKPVIRITEGGNHRDGPEVSIEISGSIAPSAIERQRAWARRIKAAEAIERALSVAAAELAGAAMELRDLGREDLATTYYEHAGTALAALDALDEQPADGAATGAGPENQETPR